MVTDVVGGEVLVARAIGIAEMICGNSPVGVSLTKQVVQQNVDGTSLDAAMALENRSQVLAAQTVDMAESLQAFREKRIPTFVNHRTCASRTTRCLRTD